MTNAAATGIDVRPRIAGVGIYAEQPGTLVPFYESLLGGTFSSGPTHDGREHHYIDIGDVHLELTAGAADDVPLISFTVADVDVALEQAVAAGGSVVSAPRDFPWGRFARVRDPHGNSIGLFTPPTTESTD